MSAKPAPIPNRDTAFFWRSCNGAAFMIQVCKDCGARQFYPRAVCRSCRSGDLDWLPASGRGKVKTFTIVHRAPSSVFRDDTPYVLALIDLEEGVRAMMNVIDCEPDGVHAGMPVRIVFEDRGGQKVPQAAPK